METKLAAFSFVSGEHLRERFQLHVEEIEEIGGRVLVDTFSMVSCGELAVASFFYEVSEDRPSGEEFVADVGSE